MIAEDLQNAAVSLLAENPDKLPQTDDASAQFMNAFSSVLIGYTNRGILATAPWRGAAVGRGLYREWLRPLGGLLRQPERGGPGCAQGGTDSGRADSVRQPGKRCNHGQCTGIKKPGEAIPLAFITSGLPFLHLMGLFYVRGLNCPC